jgi:hypothetical protein
MNHAARLFFPQIPSPGWERARVRGIEKADTLFLSRSVSDKAIFVFV